MGFRNNYQPNPIFLHFCTGYQIYLFLQGCMSFLLYYYYVAIYNAPLLKQDQSAVQELT